MDSFLKLIAALLGSSFLPRAVNTQTDTPAIQIVRSAIGITLVFFARSLFGEDGAEMDVSTVAALASFLILLVSAFAASVVAPGAASDLFVRLVHISTVYWIVSLVAVILFEGLLFSAGNHFLYTAPIFQDPNNNEWVVTCCYTIVALLFMLLLDRARWPLIVGDRTARPLYLATLFWTTVVNAVLFKAFIIDGVAVKVTDQIKDLFTTIFGS